MGNNAVSVTPGASIVVVGGDVGRDDVGEGIHSNFDLERVLERKIWLKTYRSLYLRVILDPVHKCAPDP